MTEARGDDARPANRLAGETSPYLLQHAHNPVDWYPWGPEALERAAREDKPILLSIGYAACHWCHVMERESFEDVATAELMNEHYVSIKVDREERPDLDAIYMDAVQAMTGSGGWPMTVFLSPDGVPFYAGTYFPKEDRYGMPAFRRVLVGVAEA
ncbi:MAG TPA: thioredoxin domain-containing protein, partial [Candidatus Dormibacteraeota bacterium]